MNKGVSTPLSRDAVIVVPGIMGSELIETATGHVLWGLSDPRWYARAWTSGSSFAKLRLTDDERAGRYGRIRAARLLRFPAFAPILQGYEPYTRLIRGIQRTTVHPDAVAEFPYDWRLPVAYNAGLLAAAAHRHMHMWRRHPAQVAAQRTDADGAPPQLVIVAHSMGGLLARNLTLISGATDEVRATVTLGTPFYGAVKAAVMLNSGRGAPAALPRVRLRDLAAGLPGLYDLLPRYRCVDSGVDGSYLSPSDVAALGGNLELAEASARWHADLTDATPIGHVQVVGAHQPTPQSLTLKDGVATGHAYTCRPAAGGGVERVDLAGDGTVARDAAQLSSSTAMPLAQTHGAISKSDEAILVVTDVLTDRRTGPWLGAGEIGIDVPDVVTVDAAFELTVTGVEHPRDASCRVMDVSSGRQILAPGLALADGHVTARASMPEPGLFRVEVTSGGASAVSQLVLAGENLATEGCEARGSS